MMSRWLEKQQQMITEEAESLGVSVIAPQGQFTSTKWQAGDFHSWQRGDSLFDIAQDMHVSLAQLMAFNEIESYAELEDGIPIYYPAPPQSRARRITVEVLPHTARMHVSKPGGAKKWAFGSMTTWDNARPGGFFPEGTNVHIVAIAKVPIEDAADPLAEAAYYLDHAALGDYRSTGILRFSLGYAWSDLEEGHIDALAATKAAEPQPAAEETATPQPVPEAPKQVLQPRVPSVLEGFDPEFIEKRLEDYKRDGSMQKFTETYQKLDPIVPCMAVFPDDSTDVKIEPTSGQKFIWIRDFAMKRPNRRLFQYQEVDIAATFEYEDEIYGRPVESVSGKNFFGIPMSMLQSQDEMYNEEVDATTRQRAGFRLTWSERYIWVPANKWLARYAPGYLVKIKTQKRKKD